MNTFYLLDANNPAERQKWIYFWNLWPEREVSAHPDYVQLFTCQFDHSFCAIMSGPEGNVLFPFIRRPINSELCKCPNNQLYDLITPYGYGGAFASGTPDIDLFWTQFDQWAEKNNVVCCFARLSLFPDQLIPFKGEVETKFLNIVRRLDLNSEAMWMDYKHKVRKNVKKAHRAGLEIEIDFTGKRLDSFLKIYYSTMNRRCADTRYFFPLKFFKNIINNLPEQFVFFHTIHNEIVVSTELVLVSAKYLYSFIGGTSTEAFKMGANDLLKHAVIEWGIKHKKEAFVLGGGYDGCDGIFRYKLSFASKGVVSFQVGKRIYDYKTYNKLITMRELLEMKHGIVWSPNSNFFPMYRS